MLTKARITKFQSLDDVTLSLGKLTVVVGASNSGKSAVLRALRTLAFNASSTGFVTSGSKRSTIVLEREDGVRVGLIRGPGLSTYVLGIGDETRELAKSGTSVPAEVAQVLRFVEVEGDNLNFAFQFDKPYLLDDTGTKVSKVLGELTNVNVIHEAVREANRRRLEARSRLKVRRGDLERLLEEIQQYKDVPAKRKKAETLAQELTTLRQDAARLTRLRKAVETLRVATGALEQARARAPRVPPPDQVAAAEEAAQRVRTLKATIAAIRREQAALGEEQALLEAARETTSRLEQQFHSRLEEAGQCPLCGMEVQTT